MRGKAADMATVPTGAWRSIEYLLTRPSVIGPLIFPAISQSKESVSLSI